MKLIRIFSLVLALLLLAGCSSGVEEPDSDSDRRDPQSTTEPIVETTPTTQEPEVLVSVECVTRMTARSGGEERTGTFGYEADGIHIIPDQLSDSYLPVCTPEGLELYELRYNEEGVIDRRSEYDYTGDGQKAEYRYYDLEDDVLASRTVYTYDEQGKLLTQVGYGRQDIRTSYWEYSYDEQGNRILSSYTDMDGVNTWRYTYTYDENGRIVTESIFFPYFSKEGHQKLGYYTYSYDASGLLMKKLWTETQGSYFVHNDYYYSYNEAGLLTEVKEIDEHGKEDGLITYTYDAQNRLTGMSEVDRDYDYSLSFFYEQLELPQTLAESARIWSQTGLISYYVSQPE